MDNFSFIRDLPEGRHKANQVFAGLTFIPELIQTFGDEISKIEDVDIVITLENRFGGKLEYAYIHEGGVHIGTDYIRTGPAHYIYLDIIHELVHIKQLWEGRDLFDNSYAYVDMPTEVEAYKVCVAAAKRIGMSNEEISEYLKVPWATEEEIKRLERNIGLS